MRQLSARVGLGAIAIVTLVALAGCTSDTHGGAGSSSKPTPSSTAALSTGKPLLSQLVVSTNGLGNLAPGQVVPAEPAAKAIVVYNPTKCVAAAEGIVAGSPGAGAWLPTYPKGLNWSGSGFPFDVGPVTGPTEPISEIEIWSPDLKTAKGIGAGSTVAQLKAAYGSSLTRDVAVNSDVYVLTGAHSKLLFEVAKKAAGLPVEETGTVVWMRIVPLAQTQLHIADTDSAGPCSF
jgi:hypothetical protein